MLSCKQMTENVTEYSEGALPLWKRIQFRLHLAMCRHCRTYVRQIELIRDSLAVLSSERPVPAAIEPGLLAEFQARSSKPPHSE